MRRIQADLDRLQPVAIEVAFESKHVTVGGDKTIQRGQRRRRALAEKAEHDAAALLYWMRSLSDAAADAALERLAGSVEALPFGIEQPAVEQAAQAAILQTTECKVGTPVRTVAVQQSQASIRTSEQNQVVTQDAHGLYRTNALQLGSQRHRLPIAAQQLPRRRARPDPGQQIVLLPSHHSCLTTAHFV